MDDKIDAMKSGEKVLRLNEGDVLPSDESKVSCHLC